MLAPYRSKMCRPKVCLLCNYGKDSATARTDNINRHMRLVHGDKSDYVGFKVLTGYRFVAVGDSHPDLFFGVNKSKTYVGYCTKCYTGFHPQPGLSEESAMKHVTAHVCLDKQVRTRKVVVKSEDASGKTVTKTEMQTGGVRITEDTLTKWKSDHKWFEILPLNDESDDYDIVGSLKKAVADSHTLYLLQKQMKQEAAPATTVTVTDDIYLQVMKSFIASPVIGEWMAVDIKGEQDKIFDTDGYNSDGLPPEANYREALRKRLFQQKRLTDMAERMRKERGDLLEKLDLAEGKYNRDTFELQQKVIAANKLLGERDEETRKLRDALDKANARIASLTEDKKF